MRYQIRLTESAFSDLENIYSYIAFDLSSPETAEKLYQKILTEIEKLAAFPFRCATVRNLSFTKLSLRQLNVKNYKVVFYPEEEHHRIIILRILHQLQNIDQYLKDLEATEEK